MRYYEQERGSAFIFLLVVILGVLVFTFSVVRLTRARIEGQKRVMESISIAAFAHLANGDATEAMNKARWMARLLGYDAEWNPTAVAQGSEFPIRYIATPSYNDGETQIGFEYVDNAGEPDFVAVNVEKSFSLLEGAFSMFSSSTNSARVSGRDEDAVIVFNLDISRSMRGKPATITQMLNVAGIPTTADDSQPFYPIDAATEEIAFPYRKMLPGLLWSRAFVYNDTLSSFEWNPSDTFACNPGPPGDPGSRNYGQGVREMHGFCVVPWTPVDPNDCPYIPGEGETSGIVITACPNQKSILYQSFTDLWMNYKRLSQYALIDFSKIATVNLNVFGSGTPAGPARISGDSERIPGTVTIFDGVAEGTDIFTTPIDINEITLFQSGLNVLPRNVPLDHDVITRALLRNFYDPNATYPAYFESTPGYLNFISSNSQCLNSTDACYMKMFQWLTTHAGEEPPWQIGENIPNYPFIRNYFFPVLPPENSRRVLYRRGTAWSYEGERAYPWWSLHPSDDAVAGVPVTPLFYGNEWGIFTDKFTTRSLFPIPRPGAVVGSYDFPYPEYLDVDASGALNGGVLNRETIDKSLWNAPSVIAAISPPYGGTDTESAFISASEVFSRAGDARRFHVMVTDGRPSLEYVSTAMLNRLNTSFGITLVPDTKSNSQHITDIETIMGNYEATYPDVVTVILFLRHPGVAESQIADFRNLFTGANASPNRIWLEMDIDNDFIEDYREALALLNLLMKKPIRWERVV